MNDLRARIVESLAKAHFMTVSEIVVLPQNIQMTPENKWFMKSSYLDMWFIEKCVYVWVLLHMHFGYQRIINKGESY